MEIRVTVKPGSSKGPLVEEAEDGLVVYLREKAVDGAANKALVEVLAGYYGVAKTMVKIKRGVTSRRKTVVIRQG